MSRKKLIALLLLPLVVALHAYLLWLGGPWRIFALVEAGFGIFLALILRDVKNLDKSG
ncbi:MAG: hypothetical protein ACR2IF_19220 [Terriglobales bacterium]